MIMRGQRGQLTQMPRFLNTVGEPARGRAAHQRAVRISIVGLRVIAVGPCGKGFAAASTAVPTEIILHFLREHSKHLCIIRDTGAAGQEQRICDSRRQYCIVRKAASVFEQLEILYFCMVSLISGADDIANDRAFHLCISFTKYYPNRSYYKRVLLFREGLCGNLVDN